MRSHGLGGQVVVELWTNRPERMQVGARLCADGRVLSVASAAPTRAGGRWPRWLVSFDGVTGRDAAERLRGAVLQAEPIHVDGALWVHELVGVPLYDEAGALAGEVEAVEANPASDLLVLRDGRVVPLTFVERDAGGRLTVSGPPGLLDPDR